MKASGWLPGSIDVTGWLVETCLPAADYLVWPLLKNRARTMLVVLLAQPDVTSLGRIRGLAFAGLDQAQPANEGRVILPSETLCPAACRFGEDRALSVLQP
ncbi:MAG: hypothetical protein IV089_10025 [Thiobacillus sp.]|nr:hypothetical protein [Thiobacillus sp.]